MTQDNVPFQSLKLSRRGSLGMFGGVAAAHLPGIALAAGDVCEFGVFPYVPALKIEQLYAPVVRAIAAELGQPVQLRTKATFEEFRQELDRQTYDLALLHPFFLIEMQRVGKYEPLCRINADLRGVVLGRRERAIYGLKNMTGGTLALPPRLAGISYLTVMSLAENGLVPGKNIQLRHYRTKVSCLHAVATGDADACVVPTFMLDQLDVVQELDLAPIAWTIGVRGLAIAAVSHFDQQAKRTVIETMTGWSKTAEGQQILDHVHWPGVVEVNEWDYARIDANLDMFKYYTSL